ncbi:MAG: hypothetical protein FD165_2366 [Gammaproteobacteria bacterium]|nr:MAG: hypothetical protein FD165_2366 [Gammaproteobacteria bacterium]TND01955.1 MAG: hypothetical protein FD120_2483 [Gammaproteobacteria bacterium]
MKILREKLAIQENMGVVDRAVRLIVGSVLIVPLVITMETISTALMDGQPYALIASFYLLLTGMMGWDPLYSVFHSRTCGLSDSNRCGTLEYQVDAALGRHPGHDQGYEAHALDPALRIGGVLYGNWYWV